MINFVLLSWNRKPFLEQFFNSFYQNVKNQDFNFYIIDNGSTDGCAELLKDISSKDTRIKLTLNQDNKGLGEYKKLFRQALKNKDAEFLMIFDDDIINFPEHFDMKMIDGMKEFQELGYLALDVVQNDKTNGAKPTAEHYQPITRNNITIEFGPAGAWSSIIRTKDLRKIMFFMMFFKFSMKLSHDTVISFFSRNLLRKKTGVLAGEKCLHATGPYYAIKYGSIKQDIEKYSKVGLNELRDFYANYKNDEL